MKKYSYLHARKLTGLKITIIFLLILIFIVFILFSNYKYMNKSIENQINMQMNQYKISNLIDNLKNSSQEQLNVTVSQLKQFNLTQNEYLLLNSIKNSTDSGIAELEKMINQRLSKEYDFSKSERTKALNIQFFCFIFILFFIVLLMLTVQRLYIIPIKKYTDKLSNISKNMHSIRVKPCGAYELYKLGKVFNRLNYILELELENRKQIQCEMRIARDEANKANKAKGEFLAHISHELRTPLSAAIGYIYLLQKTGLTNIQNKYCNSIQTSINSLLEIINDILDFSKIESGVITFENISFNLINLIYEIRDIFENAAKEKNLYFELSLQDDLPCYVCGDPTRLKQILINLVGNAVKFTEKGGVNLIVRTEKADFDNIVIAFFIKDTGIGVSDEDKKRIFEPFEQVDASITRKYGGTGLGLVISKNIVEAASDGKYTLDVKSNISKGSTFYFKMQFKYSDKIKNNNYNNQIVAFKKNILLVDDNEINLIMEKEVLTSFGLNVVTKNNGKDAIKAIQKQVFDMVLLDIRMPDMDGYTLAKHIRKNNMYRSIPILALTADAITNVHEKARESGINDIAIKPLNPHDLYVILEHYFELAASKPEILTTDENCLFKENEALKNLNGNKECLYDLCDRFLRSHKSDAEYIKIHIKNNHLNNARIILHNLIGLSGNLCCYSLANVSKKLLNEIHNEKSDCLEDFTNIFNDTISELSKFKSPVKYENNKVKSPDLIKKLKFLCENYDLDAVNIFKQQSTQLKQYFQDKRYKDLSFAIDNYDFIKALKILNEIE